MISSVIGLMLLYSLLSLLASAIQESIAGWMSLRGRMLDQALARMLGRSDAPAQQPPSVADAAAQPAPLDLYREFQQHDWFQQLLPKQLAGWGVRYPSYLDKKTFSTILLHVLNGSSAANIQQALNLLPEGTLKVFLLNTLADAEGDIHRFRDALEQWYDLTMDRVSGWYKRKTHAILLGIGLTMAALFNADTFAVYQHVSGDPQAQQQVVTLAEDLLNQNLQLKDSLAQDSLIINQLDSTRTLVQTLNTQLSEAATPLGLGWTAAQWQAFKEAGLSHQLLKLLGFIITAFAISLGAPFWFDLLKQFVNIRNTGQKS